MTSVKVKFRASSVKDHEGTIYYSIIHDRNVRQLSTQYHIMPYEWDIRYSTVKTGSNSYERKLVLLTIREQIHSDVSRLKKIAGRLHDIGLAYTADDVVEEFRRYAIDYSLSAYMEGLIRNFKEHGRVRTSETYRATLNSFSQYRNGEDIMLDSITSEVIEGFEAWHKSRGNTPNTISFYMRILRAVYNRAIEDGMVEDGNPFKRVYTGVDRTVKRAIPIKTLSKLKKLNLSLSKQLDFARDMFLMSFYLRGISFIDLAFLKKTDLKNNILSYRRRKTGRMLNIGWTHEMQVLLEKYGENPTEYLMPIITKTGINPRKKYLNALCVINRNLKIIGNMIGLTDPLTLYVARHSWASAAKANGIPISVISEGMGHDNEATTQIYLDSLANSVVDQANRIILESIL